MKMMFSVYFVPILLLTAAARNSNGVPNYNRATMAHALRDKMKELISDKKILRELEIQDVINHAMDIPEHRGHVTAHHTVEAELLLELLEAQEEGLEGNSLLINGSDIVLSDELRGNMHIQLGDLKDKLNSRSPRIQMAPPGGRPTTARRRHKRTVAVAGDSCWERGIVPYVTANLTIEDAAHVRQMMDIWEHYTMFRFVPWTTTTQADYDLGHTSYINLVVGGGCYSGVGTAKYYSAGHYDVSCCKGNTCLHELGHVLGLGHEQQNPDRDDFEQMLYEHMKPAYRYATLLQFLPRDVKTFHYVDYSSVMHYWFMSFHENYQYVLRLLNSDFDYQLNLWSGVNLYYEANQLQDVYNITIGKCSGLNTACSRDGYMSYMDGVCRCRCPTGLAPQAACTQLEPTVVSMETWPEGTYALLKPDDGCPPGFTTGSVYHVAAGLCWMSEYDDAAGDLISVDGMGAITHEFCVRDDTLASDATWDKGSYCIHKGANGGCPIGFEEGHIAFDDNSAYATTSSGSLPDGQFTGDVLLMFCCKSDAVAARPMSMPTTGPFILYQYGEACQTVAGMNYRTEFFAFRNMKGTPTVYGASGAAPYTYTYSDGVTMGLYYCYYTHVEYDCGAIISLSDERPNVRITSPNYPEPYPDNKRCTWFMETAVDTQIVLKFDSFNLQLSPNGDCADAVEVRHSLPGNEGQRYCGDSMNQTFVSERNYLAVYLHTDHMNSTSTGFTATVRLLKPDIQPECVNSGGNPNCDYWADNGECHINPTYMLAYCEKSCDVCIQGLCYTNQGRRGSYSGTKNVTRHYQDCQPWSKVTNCPHNPFEDGDVDDSLDSNYCRNPGHGTSPWCYTSIENCDRDYCDVCSIYACVDAFSDCPEINAESKVCADHGDDCKATCNLCVTCVNGNTNCDYWASVGECDNNPRYMLHQCKAACGVCTPVTCVNGNTYCDYWASVGECDNNPRYMLHQCKAACGVCTTEPCADILTDCQSQIDDEPKFCDINPGNDAARCAATCGTCTGPDLTTCDPPSSLVDSSYIPVKPAYTVGETVTYVCTNAPTDKKERVCSSRGTWKPELNFICGTCPDGFEYKHDSCFQFVDEFTTFSLAAAHCAGIGAVLTGAADTATATLVREEVKQQEYGDIAFWVRHTQVTECAELANNRYAYDGTVAATEYNETCIAWTDISLSYIIDANFPTLDGSVAGSRNYCRNPNGTEERPWCFTSTSGSSGRCVVGIPDCDANCKNNNGYCDYWASIGECHKNPGFMLYNCRKACAMCHNPFEVMCDEMKEATRYAASCGNLNPFVCEYHPAARHICIDQRPDSCTSDLRQRPSACVDFPNYAKTNCPMSCGLCTDADPNVASTVTCSDPAPLGDFTLVEGGAMVPVGGVYGYVCDSGTTLASGQLVRRCTESGSLSGSPPVCQPTDQVDTLNTALEIRKRLSIAHSGYVYIGDNANLRLPKAGKVKKWKFYNTNRGSMELQVWRKIADKSFTLIGSNSVPVAREWRLQTANVNTADQIAVQQNDVIGFLFTGASGGGVSHDRCTDALSPEGTNVYQSSSTFAVGSLVVGNTYSFADVPVVVHSGVDNRCRIYSMNALVGP